MPQSLANVLLHLVFSTKDRFPFIREDVRPRLSRYVGGLCREINCPSIVVGGTADHLHVVCSLSRALSIAELLEEVKKRSSRWVKTQDTRLSKFAWQTGYGAFSIGQSQVEAVREYVRTQAEHHRHVTFQEEFREFLRRYQVTYDERYVWD